MSGAETTRRRAASLETYMSANVTGGPGRFRCPSLASCKASALGGHPAGSVSYYKGQLSHVGDHYDLVEDGHPIRILVLGMETGRKKEDVTLQERSREQRPVMLDDPSARKPHMKGTTSALRLMLGRRPGPDLEGDMIDLAGGPRVHVMDAYSLANIRLCSAVRIGSTSSMGTDIMSANCLRHLAETVRILEPTLCILQSARTRAALTPQISSQVHVGPHLERVTLAGVDTLVASFVHPYQYGRNKANDWGSTFSTPYLDEVVAPALRRARMLHGLGPGEPGAPRRAPGPVIPSGHPTAGAEHQPLSLAAKNAPWTIDGVEYRTRREANRGLAALLVTYTEDEWTEAQKRHGLR